MKNSSQKVGKEEIYNLNNCGIENEIEKNKNSDLFQPIKVEHFMCKIIINLILVPQSFHLFVSSHHLTSLSQVSHQN